jgi:hypothetical protein
MNRKSYSGRTFRQAISAAKKKETLGDGQKKKAGKFPAFFFKRFIQAT